MSPCMNSPNKEERRHFLENELEEVIGEKNDEDQGEDLILRKSLIERFDNEGMAKETSSKNNDRKPLCTTRRLILLSSSILLVLLGLVLFAHISCKTNDPSQTYVSRWNHKNDDDHILHRLGWVDTIQYFQRELARVSNQIKEEQYSSNNSSTLIEIDPLCDLMELALDTVGLRGVYLGILNDDLENYYIVEKGIDDDEVEERECAYVGHGVGCEAYDIWWIWHYIGATTAEKLLRDGSLLLDANTGEHLHHATEVMKELHRIQSDVFANTASYHIEHGFVWHYLTATQPYLTSYPIEIANEFCGYFLDHHVQGKGYTTKGIGAECYHAIGHAIFEIIAMRQLHGPLLSSSFSARTQLRPRSGFQLTDNAICDGYYICKDAPTEETAPLRFCHGGIIHTQRLMNPELQDHAQADPFFDLKWDMCETRLG